MNNADPESQSLIAQLLLLVVLTFINAFLAAAEIAVVSVNKNRVEQKRKTATQKLKNCLRYCKTPITFIHNPSRDYFG